jgi:hypothetical protein
VSRDNFGAPEAPRRDRRHPAAPNPPRAEPELGALVEPPDDPEGSLRAARDVAAMRRLERSTADAKGAARRAHDEILELREALARYDFAGREPTPIVLPPLNKSPRNACAVALLSDVHFDEQVQRTSTIRNEYTVEIARARLARFFRGVEWLTRNQRGFKIRALVLWLGGDFISGQIHEELAETTALPPGESMLAVRDCLIAGIRQLARIEALDRIVIPCSYGNHGRTTDKMRAATGHGHSWEWVMYQSLAEHFELRAATDATARKIGIHAPPGEHQVIEAADHNLAFHHGHRIRYAGGIGGITVPLIKKVVAWDKWSDADYYHFGHFHQLIDLGRIMVNGSVIGPNAYAQSIGATPEPPRQGYYVLDAKRGKTAVSPVWVSDDEEDRTP